MTGVSVPLRGLGTVGRMANPEELRRQDKKLPKQRRRYPESLVTKSLWVLLAIVLVGYLVSLL